MPETSVYSSNIVHLPSTLQDQLDHIPSIPDSSIHQSKGGTYWIDWVQNNKKQSLNSRTDPIKSASRQMVAKSFTKSSVFIFLGFGLGYHFKAWCERYPQVERILVIEKDPSLFKTALSLMSFSTYFQKSKLQIALDPNLSELGLILSNFTPQDADHIQLILHPVLTQNTEFYDPVKKLIAQTVTTSRSTMGTAMINRRKIAFNLLANTRQTSSHFQLAPLKNLAQGRPTIVVGAGPSLDSTLASLKTAAKKAVIVATDTSLPTLYKANIQPDFVASIDYNPRNARHFEACWEFTSNSCLVAGYAVHHKIPSQFKGPKFLYSTPNAILDHVGPPPGPEVFELSWSSAGLGLVLGHFLGSPTIYLVGQDLSFPSDQLYAKETQKNIHIKTIKGCRVLVETQTGKVISQLRTVPGYRGEVDTTIEMYTSIKNTADVVHYLGCKTVHVCDNGAEIRGTKHLKIADFSTQINRYPSRPTLAIEFIQQPDVSALQAEFLSLFSQTLTWGQQGLMLLKGENLNAEIARKLDEYRHKILADSRLIKWIEYVHPSQHFLITRENQNWKENPTKDSQIRLNKLFFEMVTQASAILIDYLSKLQKVPASLS